MSDEPVPDPTHTVLVEIRDELRALNRSMSWPSDEGDDENTDDAVPVDGR